MSPSFLALTNKAGDGTRQSKEHPSLPFPSLFAAGCRHSEPELLGVDEAGGGAGQARHGLLDEGQHVVRLGPHGVALEHRSNIGGGQCRLEGEERGESGG